MLQAMMGVLRYDPETGDEVELEVVVEGEASPPDPAVGERCWGVEGVTASVHGCEPFELTAMEAHRGAWRLIDGPLETYIEGRQ